MTPKLPPPSPTRNITTAEKIAMQTRLKELGLYKDAIDGLWGANSTAAMKEWQWFHSYPLQDGVPTFDQMVELGAAQREVIPKPQRSSAGSGFIINLLLKALPLFISLLPKVNLPMNPLLLALGRVNKTWVAAIVSFLSTNILLFFFGFELSADTQTLIVTGATAVITGLATWLIPNAPPPPLQSLGLLNRSIASATTEQLIEYQQASWPIEQTVAVPPRGSYPDPIPGGDAPLDEASSLKATTATQAADAPRTGY